MNSNTQEAFLWIVEILEKHQIPFQITGGLAAIIYGVNRPLYDIDIDVPEEHFKLIIPDVFPSIQFGPGRFNDTSWDIYLLTLCYKGQLIDIGGAYQTKIFNPTMKSWELLAVDFSRAEKINVYGKNISVIPKLDLIQYKSKLNREVDQLDLLALNKI